MQMLLSDLAYVITENWVAWLVTVVLILGSVIDAIELKVPNWLTYPFIISGWIYAFAAFGWYGLGWSVLGTCVAMACLLPMYSIGGMGAGDVKLLAGVGAWLTIQHTVWGFVVGVFIGAAMGIAMALVSGQWKHHYDQFWVILKEIVTNERSRLIKAQAVLRCVAFALLYEDWLAGPNRPCFADAVAVIEDLVAQTVEQLGTGAGESTTRD